MLLKKRKRNIFLFLFYSIGGGIVQRLTIILSVLMMLGIISGCTKKDTANLTLPPQKVAFVNYEELVEAHPLFAQYKAAEQAVTEGENYRQAQVQLAQKQMMMLNQVANNTGVAMQVSLNTEFVTKMTELETKENQALMLQAQKFDTELTKEMKEQYQAIEEKYKNPLFNLHVKLETLKLKDYEKDSLMSQLAELQQARANEMNKLNAIKEQVIDKKMQNARQEAAERLDKKAQELRAELQAKEKQEEKNLVDKISPLSPEFDKNIAEIDKDISLKNAKAENFYKQITNDIMSQAMKISKIKNYSIVLKEIKVNVDAADITAEIKEAMLTDFANKKEQSNEKK